MGKKAEREELIVRLVVLIITGVILHIWTIFVIVFAIVNFFVVLIEGKRNNDLANFCGYYGDVLYGFVKYITFQTNKRPFPFTPLERVGKLEK